MRREEGERRIQRNQRCRRHGASGTEQRTCEVCGEQHERRQRDGLRDRDHPRVAPRHAERRKEQWVPRKPQRLWDEWLADASVRVLAALDEATGKCDVLSLVIARRVPIGGEIGGIRDREHDRCEREHVGASWDQTAEHRRLARRPRGPSSDHDARLSTRPP